MADAAGRAWRERLVALVALAFGNVGDIKQFIETGDVCGTAKSNAPTLTPEVARHMKACEIAGRFVMPDEVEKFLNGTPASPQ